MKIHSFLKGTITLRKKNTSDKKYKLLSPAHFVLEQVKKLLGGDASPSFVSYTTGTMTCTSDNDKTATDDNDNETNNFMRNKRKLDNDASRLK